MRAKPGNLRDQVSNMELWQKIILEHNGDSVPVETIRKMEKRLAPTPSGNWPTPTCADTFTSNLKSSHQKNDSMHSVSLSQAVTKWPTPQSRDWKGSSGRSYKGTEQDLPTKVATYPTLAARDYKGANNFDTSQNKMENGKRAHMGQLPNFIQAHEGEAIKSKLNPDWVEWLMGWPIGWTNLDLLPCTDIQYYNRQWWHNDPADLDDTKVPRVANNIKNRANRLRAIGNGQVPATAVLAWYILGGPILGE